MLHHQEEGFGYSYAFMEYAARVSPHFHNCYELFLLQKGDVEYIVESNSYDMQAGDLIFTNPREMHYPAFRSAVPYERSLIFLKSAYLSEFISGSYDPFAALENRKLGTQNHIPAQKVAQSGIGEKFRLIGSLAESDVPEREALLKSHLIQLLVTINRMVVTEGNCGRGSKIEDIIEYVNRNLTASLSLDQLARQFYLNKFHISHLFREKTGLSLTEYISNKRVMLAKERILAGEPLERVCEACGFGDYSGFYRAFKKILGISPSELKKQPPAKAR